ncbi:tetratricopeptide repeat protein [Nocardia sp. CDC159]|uniref:Tetratricopeptide repeat protein n=1 Tax=Nocardia pulmonis TaxID=2951408 RepID=A0A9X2E9J7_9NOCA|nr:MULTISPECIES: BTAD domain-containing putative transcriptional regulator [Nocardia]MCM6776802.1 tetratricopeptide repeat protein [Nocardia pulmonis]MCM6789049.1 tetratricopeptide repeat protein [Nocardia sp. CDC159]
MEFRILGPVELRTNEAVIAPGGHRQRTLLVALLLRANTPASTAYLSEAVWERPPCSPESNLRTYIAELRRWLHRSGVHESRLQTRPGGYTLVLEPGESDLANFEALVERGTRRWNDGDSAGAATCFGQALDLWRGEPFEDLPSPSALLRAERTRLEDRRLAVVERYARARIELGEADAVLGELRVLTARYPMREELWLLLMLALYRGGRQAAALQTYTQARRNIVEALGIEPGPRLRALHQQILVAEPPPAEAAVADINPPVRPAMPKPRQLPPDVRHFIGRRADLAALDEIADSASAGAAPVVISAIAGIAGVGKTALAVHFAHRVADRYGDGHLYVNLRGFDPQQPPVPASEALGRFLRALGVIAEQIPADPAERAGLYRTLLADKSVLIVLDNAATAEQVRPLLPGSPSCLVLITSRNQLHGLVATHGAHQVTLDTLRPHETVTLLREIIGPDRVDAESGAAGGLARLCGHLPLAVRVAAANLVVRPHDSIGQLVATMERDDRLVALEVGDDAEASVRRAFESSYRALNPELRRLFRRLGLVPGADFTVYVAAALVERPVAQAQSLLDGLAAAHLVEPYAPGRYRLHDLLGLYACDRAHADEHESEREHAVRRLVEWYLYACAAADRALMPQKPQIPDLAPPGPHRETPDLATYDAALSWCDGEQQNVAAVIRVAARRELPTHAWKLAVSLWQYWYQRRQWHEAEAACRIGLESARRTGDRHGEAWMLTQLGIVLFEFRRFDEAVDHQRRSVALFRGEFPPGEAMALENLGSALARTGRFDEAVECHRRSRNLFREAGIRGGECIGEYGLALTYQVMNRFDEALDHFGRALAIAREIDSHWGEGWCLLNVGKIRRQQHRFDEAIDYFERSAEVFAAMGYRWGRAAAMTELGQALRQTGRADAAHRCLSTARIILDEFDDPESPEIRARLERYRHGRED